MAGIGSEVRPHPFAPIIGVRTGSNLPSKGKGLSSSQLREK